MKGFSGAAAIAMFGLAAASHAVSIDVYQGSRFKGTIEAYNGTATAADNYDYFSASAHPVEGPNLRFNRGEIFFYEGAEGLTFNVIFNKERNSPSDPITEGAIDWNIAAFSLSSDTPVLLSDDNRELREPDPGFFRGRWQWRNNTDGGIIGGLNGPVWILAVNPQYYDGIDSLRLFSGDGSRINLNLRTGPRGNLFFVPHGTLVPDSAATLGLLGIGVAGLLCFAHRPFSNRIGK